MPQLALSIVYLQHNGILTRMLSAREWASYSNTRTKHNFYRGLRVTAPAPGSAQVSTWRLQLPYRYGVPFMASSALMHWLVSNCVYVLVMEGGYVDTRNSMEGKANEAGLSEDVAMTIGYSLRAMVVTLVLGVLAICVPIALGMKRLHGEMPVVGSNSMAISAACHVVLPVSGNKSAVSGAGYQEEDSQFQVIGVGSSAPGIGAVGEELELERLPMFREQSLVDADQSDELMERETLSRGLLRWGVVDAGDGVDIDPIGHLSFGRSGQVLGEPAPGRLYA